MSPRARPPDVTLRDLAEVGDRLAGASHVPDPAPAEVSAARYRVLAAASTTAVRSRRARWSAGPAALLQFGAAAAVLAAIVLGPFSNLASGEDTGAAFAALNSAAVAVPAAPDAAAPRSGAPAQDTLPPHDSLTAARAPLLQPDAPASARQAPAAAPSHYRAPSSPVVYTGPADGPSGSSGTLAVELDDQGDDVEDRAGDGIVAVDEDEPADEPNSNGREGRGNGTSLGAASPAFALNLSAPGSSGPGKGAGGGSPGHHGGKPGAGTRNAGPARGHN